MIKSKHISAYPTAYVDLFGSNRTLREFLNHIERLTGPGGIPFRNQDDRLKFKGDALEVLSELVFTLKSTDERMGLTDYTPILITDDYGVDATGINANGHKAMVQVKYRSNPKDVVTYAEIARTYCSGVIQQGLSPDQASTVFVFTTADEVSRQCQLVLGNRLVILSRPIIKMLIDNNSNFWSCSVNLINEYIAHHSSK